MDNAYPLFKDLVKKELKDDEIYVCYVSEHARQTNTKMWITGNQLKKMGKIAEILKDIETDLLWKTDTLSQYILTK